MKRIAFFKRACKVAPGKSVTPRSAHSRQQLEIKGREEGGAHQVIQLGVGRKQRFLCADLQMKNCQDFRCSNQNVELYA